MLVRQEKISVADLRQCQVTTPPAPGDVTPPKLRRSYVARMLRRGRTPSARSTSRRMEGWTCATCARSSRGNLWRRRQTTRAASAAASAAAIRVLPLAVRVRVQRVRRVVPCVEWREEMWRELCADETRGMRTNSQSRDELGDDPHPAISPMAEYRKRPFERSRCRHGASDAGMTKNVKRPESA